ncbi:MAG: ATP-binding cassette domain-containing protein [Acidobacteriota bacterium]
MIPRAAPLFSAHHVSRTFGRTHALVNIDLELRAGETVALFGPNGAGKTTLLRLAATLLPPTRGLLRLEGRVVRGATRSELRRRIGLVTHASFLYTELTAEENLLLHARLRAVDSPRDHVDHLLRQVGLWDRRMERVAHFSRGMQQRLTLARALVGNPDILFLDEPFSGLDTQGSECLAGILQDGQQAGRATLFSSHDLPRGLALAHRYILLEAGQVRTSRSTAPFRLDSSRRLVSLESLVET